jgi:hypothetical protein
LKKPAGSVRFRFYKQKTEKTEPNRKKPKKNEPNQAKTGKTKPKPEKTEKTEPNRFEPVFALKKPKPVGLTWFLFGFGFFFKKNSV